MMRRPSSLRRMLFQLAQAPVIVLLLLLVGINLLQIYFSYTNFKKEQHIQASSIALQASHDLEEIRNLVDATGQILKPANQISEKQIILDVLRSHFPYFQALYYTDENGIVLIESTNSLSMKDMDISGAEYYKKVVETKSTFISSPYISMSTGRATINIAVPSYQNSRIMRILVAELDMKFIQGMVESLENRQNTYNFIIDRYGNIIAHPESSWVEEKRNLSNIPFIAESLQQENEQVGFYYDEYKQYWQIASTIHMDYGWVIVTSQPILDVFLPVIITLISSILAFAVSVGVYGWAHYYSVEMITRPIGELAHKADLIAQEHYDTLPLEKISDIIEIKSLTNSFRRMMESVKERTNALRESNVSLEIQIRERLQAEEKIRLFNAELEQRVLERTAQLAATNQELESFSYSVSHDLRAPLRSIDGFSHMLEEETRNLLSPDATRYLQRIREGVTRMANLIEALLSLSKVTRSSLRQETINLSQQAMTIAENLQLANPARKVEWLIADDILVTGDGSLLQNLLQNLISNAWKFTAHQLHPKIEFGVLAGSPKVYFVRDNGAGFKMEYASRLFGAFQRLHSDQEFEGTGIGLATVQRIILRHGGRIWAEGKPNEGATFYFTLWE